MLKHKRSIVQKAIFVVAATLITACQSVRVPVPEGFAYYDKPPTNEVLYAVAPERVVYRVRKVEPDPKADLDFWKTALLTQFKKTGYIVLNQQTITAKNTPGYSFTLATTYNSKDYTYQLNVFVNVMLIEASGENKYFEKYRNDISAVVTQTDFETISCHFCQLRPSSVKTDATGKSHD